MKSEYGNNMIYQELASTIAQHKKNKNSRTFLLGICGPQVSGKTHLAIALRNVM